MSTYCHPVDPISGRQFFLMPAVTAHIFRRPCPRKDCIITSFLDQLMAWSRGRVEHSPPRPTSLKHTKRSLKALDRTKATYGFAQALLCEGIMSRWHPQLSAPFKQPIFGV
jgi:hypothetical protein